MPELRETNLMNTAGRKQAQGLVALVFPLSCHQVIRVNVQYTNFLRKLVRNASWSVAELSAQVLQNLSTLLAALDFGFRPFYFFN